MSNLLDQAIVDAEALKEVAMRNAEAAILDKFSNQIKEAVEQILEDDILEQEEDDPFGVSGDEGVEDLEAAAVEDEDGADLDIPLANAEGVEMCACPDIETVHIDLTNLEDEMETSSDPLRDAEEMGAESEEEENEREAMGNITSENLQFDQDIMEQILSEVDNNVLALDEEKLEELSSDDLTLEEEVLEELMSMLEQDTMGMSPDAEAQEAAQRASEVGGETAGLESTTQAGVQRQNESVDAVEEVVEEALTVDIDPLATRKSGHGPAPDAVFELAEEEMLAMLQDSEKREKFDEMQKALKDLQESNDKLSQDILDLSSDKKELIKIVGKIKNQLAESNLTNAKLLYTNKVLMGDSLNERQKNKIVEALSNSESVEEAKVIYETLRSATGSTIKNNKPESLSEAMNKTTSTLILSHRNRDRDNHKTQNDLSSERWKILAGLNKK